MVNVSETTWQSKSIFFQCNLQFSIVSKLRLCSNEFELENNLITHTIFIPSDLFDD